MNRILFISSTQIHENAFQKLLLLVAGLDGSPFLQFFCFLSSCIVFLFPFLFFFPDHF